MTEREFCEKKHLMLGMETMRWIISIGYVAYILYI